MYEYECEFCGYHFCSETKTETRDCPDCEVGALGKLTNFPEDEYPTHKDVGI